MPRKATFSKLDAWLECDQALTAAHLYKQERRVSANTLPEADDHLRSSEITIEIAMSVAGMRVGQGGSRSWSPRSPLPGATLASRRSPNPAPSYIASWLEVLKGAPPSRPLPMVHRSPAT
jgi:hypothetical protein